MRALQLRQLTVLLTHAHAHVPALRPRLDASLWRPGQDLTAEIWRSIPLLTRRDIQEAGPGLHAQRTPPSHGKLGDWRTSGSSGMPVTGRRTELSHLIWMATSLREILWHRLDFTAGFALIRRDRTTTAPAEGRRLPHWGDGVATAYATGPGFLLDTMTSPEEQAVWLLRERPAYLMSYPGILDLLARHCLEHRIALPDLRLVRCFGEAVTDELRNLLREAWNVEIMDTYSAEEVGHIALQCPDYPGYHVPAETILVEILRDDGTDCDPGETGRVVVTPLNNFATPLLRYDIGDRATVGPPCACGRRLPVITRILGRERHRMIMPDGSRRFTSDASKAFTRYPAIIQAQIAQTALTELEIRLVLRRPFTAEEEAHLGTTLRADLGQHLTPRFVYLDAIPRSPTGKFETFRCEIV